jgi:hypothetical protein
VESDVELGSSCGRVGQEGGVGDSWVTAVQKVAALVGYVGAVLEPVLSQADVAVDRDGVGLPVEQR